MQSVIMLLINGDMFLFCDNNFSHKQQAALSYLAECAYEMNPLLESFTEREVCDWFIRTADETLNIELKLVDISSIVRIK